ncbi:MAG: hypothetical protein VB081_04280, partial [Christensenella sp.]|uniref:hypothetical protein n=1 Tax=Christensenella sp. TaxID=1935934 RepID=UPI002B20E17A
MRSTNTVADLAAGAQPMTPEEAGIRDYLKAHPNETINGVNAAMLGDFEQQMDEAQKSGVQMTTKPAEAPAFLRDEVSIKKMQKELGISETGQWDDSTEQAYRARMGKITGLVYQDQPELAGLPFDQAGMAANGCSTTATHNVLQLMGKSVPFEQTYAWHSEHGDANFPRTIPWRTEQYVKEAVPDVRIRNASTAYAMVVPEDRETSPLEARAQKVISEDGYGILCFAYKNPDGSIGAHYVAAEIDPQTKKLMICDYTPAGNGQPRVAGKKPYINV